MQIMFWVLVIILDIAVLGAIFGGLYLIIKTAVKKGILEAYNQIRKDKGQSGPQDQY